jgi:hypothetical protein
MGSRYKIDKKHGVKMLLHYEQRLDATDKDTKMMVAVNYQYKIPSKKAGKNN